MLYLSRSILLLICLTVLFASFGRAQEKAVNLKPNQPLTFALSPSGEKSFVLTMNEDDFAEINWLANDNLILSFQIYDSARKLWLTTNSSDEDSLSFVAPKASEYTLVITFENKSEITESQNISLEYKNKFKLPAGSKPKDIRKINGYDVKIIIAPGMEAEYEDSIVLIERNGKLKKIMKHGAGGVAGFSFADDITKAYSAQAKRVIPLIKSTLDKTGDGIPDVMINYFSGGTHCCSETYFINLGETVETVDSIGTGHTGMIVSGKNPKGGLLFETADNAYAYWLTYFANSPFPGVILEFKNGKLQPNFELMKKPAPSLAVLKKRAFTDRQQLSLEPYYGENNESSILYKEDANAQTVFWGVMLDLIYTGHEELAWQYLDLVWDTKKQGKKIFINDFKNRLANSQYWQITKKEEK